VSVITQTSLPQPRVKGQEGIVFLDIPSGVNGGTYRFEFTALAAQRLSIDIDVAVAVATDEFSNAVSQDSEKTDAEHEADMKLIRKFGNEDN
jgi:hypothetical protein